MLIDVLIVDRYEIKKFKLWNNNKKKQKEVMWEKSCSATLNLSMILVSMELDVERFMGLWSGRMQLNSAWMLRKPSYNFGKAFVQSPHWIH